MTVERGMPMHLWWTPFVRTRLGRRACKRLGTFAFSALLVVISGSAEAEDLQECTTSEPVRAIPAGTRLLERTDLTSKDRSTANFGRPRAYQQ